jgi:hypothetical protein
VAELEVAVNYRTRPAKIGLYTMMVLMPVWAIGVPFCLGLFLVLLQQQPVAFLPALLTMCVLISIPLVAVLLAAVCEDDLLTVSKEGLTFPLMFLPMLQYRRSRLWSDLRAAKLISDAEKKSNILLLEFKSGGKTQMNLGNVSKSDQEQILLATEVWAKNCERAPELITYQNQLQNEARGVDHLSYTQMWEEELSRRFSATSFVPLEPDQILQNGRLKIVRQLAFGGLSAIYLAQEDGKQLVVLKEAVVPASADAQSKAKAAELFEREARLLIRLDHDNIARVFDHFAESGRNYLVLEYIHGQDLRQFIKQHGPQSEALVLNWAAQIAAIIGYLHAQTPPIIHRDLTPDNLVRRDDDSIVLIDFGAANEFVGTATGTLVGKQAYIAPEQLRGKATILSDVYALGGTIHFFLTGKDPEPLTTSHPAETVSVSTELDRIVAACTEMEECDRPQRAEDIAREFSELAAKHTPSPEPAAAGDA